MVSIESLPAADLSLFSTPSAACRSSVAIVVFAKEIHRGRPHLSTARCAHHRHQDGHAREMALSRSRTEGLDSGFTNPRHVSSERGREVSRRTRHSDANARLSREVRR